VRSYLDALTNWYVRRSRDRFWVGDTDAFDTLYTVLETVSRVIAPLAPMVSEQVWRGLTGGRSVHLTDWPEAAQFPADHELVAAMDAVRDVCSAALSLRKARGQRVRLPLASLTVATPNAAALRPFADLIADEVNVKQVVLTDDVAEYCMRVLSLVPRVLGPRLGGAVQNVIKAVRAGDWSVADGVVTAGGVVLEDGEFELKLVAADVEHSAPLPGAEGVVVLDTVVTPELAAEGLARDVVRVVQQARRDADLNVSDRISLVVSASPAVAAAVEKHRDFVGSETLATSVSFGAVDGGFAGEAGDGETVEVQVSKV
jgi:isoleucyl-tRNA synthetase